MDFFLGLPTHWAYVHYENGEEDCVANTDFLNEKEALEYKKMWDKPNNKIVKVTLRDNDDNIVSWFEF